MQDKSLLITQLLYFCYNVVSSLRTSFLEMPAPREAKWAVRRQVKLLVTCLVLQGTVKAFHMLRYHGTSSMAH